MTTQSTLRTPCMALLKSRTASWHEHTERQFDLPHRLSSRAVYAQCLARFYGYYAPLEERLANRGEASTIGLNLERRQKVAWLRADLEHLGWSSADIEDLAQCPEVGPIEQPPELLGTLYVTEGATLGGQFIRKEVEARLGLKPGAGCSFFAGYGHETAEMWRSFGAALNAYAAQHPEEEEEIVSAACHTFRSLGDWIQC